MDCGAAKLTIIDKRLNIIRSFHLRAVFDEGPKLLVVRFIRGINSNMSSIILLEYGVIITFFPVHKEDSDLGSINHCHNITTTELLFNFFLLSLLFSF